MVGMNSRGRRLHQYFKAAALIAMVNVLENEKQPTQQARLIRGRAENLDLNVSWGKH